MQHPLDLPYPVVPLIPCLSLLPPDGLGLFLELPQCLLVFLPLHPQLSVLALDPFELALALAHLLKQPHTRLLHRLQEFLRPHLCLTPSIFQVL